MPLDPQCAAIIAAAAQAGSVPFGGPDHLTIRAGYEAGTAGFAYDPGPVTTRDTTLPGSAGALPVRVYSPPEAGAPLPALIFFHGGGWVVGSLASHDHLCRHLCVKAGVAVLAVDYRLAPEHPFPAAFEDCLAVTRAVRDAAAELGLDRRRLAVGGDSAGGQLAASVCLALRDAGEPLPIFQLLIYPVCDLLAENTSMKDNAKGYLLTVPAYHRMCDWYVESREQWGDWRLSPQRAQDHRGLPPALIQTAEFDPLRDEGKAYAETLQAAGVSVDYRCHAGMIHGFARMGGKVDAGRAALDEASTALRRALLA
jgi:acetyl esterase